MMTKKDADRVVENNSAFRKRELVLDGFNIAIYNYRVAEPKDFLLKSGEDNFDALEMRGLTFTRPVGGSGEWLCYPHLPKFFNLNQTPRTQYAVLSKKRIRTVYPKVDGSMITFIPLGTGFHAKTRRGFDTPQALQAQKYYDDNIEFQAFVKFCYAHGVIPIFEYVGPRNRIVVPYPNTGLVLLQARNICDGSICTDDAYAHAKKYGVKTSFDFAYFATIPNTLDTLVDSTTVDTGDTIIEGWVVEFYGGTTVKVKTHKYFVYHKILTESLYRENIIVEAIFSGTIDKMLSIVPSTGDIGERKLYVEALKLFMLQHFSDTVSKIQSLVRGYDGNRKDFASSHINWIYFPILMRAIGGRSGWENSLISFILKRTYHLEKAKVFLNIIGFNTGGV